MPNTPAVHEFLDKLSSVPDLSEVTHVTRFRGFWNRSSGPHEVTIDFHDTGTPGSMRWSVVVTNVDTGAVATGNPQRDFSTALSLIHWADLDRAPAD